MLARAAALLALRAQHAAPLFGAVRSYAAAATAADKQAHTRSIKLPDPPLKLSGTSASIATLLWQISLKENALEKVQDELHQMVEAFREFPELRQVALDPFVPTITKVRILDAILKDSPATPVTKKFFHALAEENALAATLQIAKAFDELMLAYRKEVYCTIVTAQPLDKLERVELKKRAEKFIEPGFKLVAKEKIEKKILGGFILEFEDRLVDMSVSKKLEEFNNLVFKLETDLKA